MSIRASNNKRRGFTLLEVMIGVGVIALITISVYRFVASTVTAIRVTSANNDDQHALVALVKAVEAELQDLPPRVNGAIRGVPHKFDNLQADELQWYCKGGNGLFTKAAEGEWYTILTIQRDKVTRELEIGVRRRPIDAKETDFKWWPLLRRVSALEVRYFDRRLNTWIERWNPQDARPALVRLRIWRDPNDPPYESVIAIPTANLQQ
jgi:type II secretion system protein J